MYKNKSQFKKKTNYPIVAVLIIVALLIVLSAVFVLEKKQIINLYTQPTKQAPVPVEKRPTPIAAPPNTVDYTPTTTNNPDRPSIKEVTPPQPTPLGDLGAVITQVRKNQVGDAILIKTAVTGTMGGICIVTAQRGALSLDATSTIEHSEPQYTCGALSIPITRFKESGVWIFTLKVTSYTGEVATTASDYEVLL